MIEKLRIRGSGSGALESERGVGYRSIRGLRNSYSFIPDLLHQMDEPNAVVGGNEAVRINCRYVFACRYNQRCNLIAAGC